MTLRRSIKRVLARCFGPKIDRKHELARVAEDLIKARHSKKSTASAYARAARITRKALECGR